MTDIGEVINGLTWPVKVGWVLWLVWVGLQIVWYQRARTSEDIATPSPDSASRESVVGVPATESRTSTSTATPRPATQTARAPRAPVKPIAPGGTPEFLAELGLLEDDDDRDKSKNK